MDKSQKDSWAVGDNYETYMGRWSAAVAQPFLDWLAPGDGLDWIEVGCGTGALTRTICEAAAPRSVLAVDPSEAFIGHARAHLDDALVRFEVGDAQALPAADASADIAVAALALNFVPNPVAGLREMARCVRAGGMVAAYVWDYPGGGMGFIDAFWKAATDLDPAAAEFDEARRFPFCTPDGLAALAGEAGLAAETATLQTRTRFADFEAFFAPFTLGAGPAPGYYAGLAPERQDALRTRLAERLGEGPIDLPARAWGVRARV